MRFRRRLVIKAIPREYQGPKKTPPSILMKCWTGAHLEAPTGIDRGEHTIPTATRIPARASLRTFTFFIFIRPFRVVKNFPGLIVTQNSENLKKNMWDFIQI
jgi:hypothetical protein